MSLCSEETIQTDTTSNTHTHTHFLLFQLSSKGCVQLQVHSYLRFLKRKKKINTFSSLPDSAHLSQSIFSLPASFSATFLFLYETLPFIFFIFFYLGSLLLLSPLVSCMTFLFFSLSDFLAFSFLFPLLRAAPTCVLHTTLPKLLTL